MIAVIVVVVQIHPGRDDVRVLQGVRGEMRRALRCISGGNQPAAAIRLRRALSVGWALLSHGDPGNIPARGIFESWCHFGVEDGRPHDTSRMLAQNDENEDRK